MKPVETSPGGAARNGTSRPRDEPDLAQEQRAGDSGAREALEAAVRARGTARRLVAGLRQRGSEGDVVALERLPAALDRLAAAEERVQAAADRVQAAADRLSAEEYLKHSHRDELTGAMQRAAGQQQLARELERSVREGSPLVVGFVDVNGLKRINDTHGHLVGDAALRAVGQALMAHVRSYDVVFRFGGDEFVCALCGVQLEEAEERFGQVAASLEQLSPGTTISVGLALAQPQDTETSLIGRADAALYERRAAARQDTTHGPP